jgi:methionine synthase II (cobalamin-independent)
MNFHPECNPVLIGSLPVEDHRQAMELILEHCPQIPLWPQLPKNPREGMVRQFLDGFPGLQDTQESFHIDTTAATFPSEMTEFYEEFFAVTESPELLAESRFALSPQSAAGFFALQRVLPELRGALAVKGQITGPVTTGIGARDSFGDPILYHDDLRDMLTKHLAMKGLWQAREMRRLASGLIPMIFIDEPGIVSFGSTGFAGVTRELVTTAVKEVIDLLKTAEILVGIHICANGDWAPSLESATDIISFDAYFYFDNFILYHQPLKAFLERGGILAWGIIPTGDPYAVERETTASLFAKWQQQLDKLSTLGLSQEQLMAQTLIAPSCGTGSLSPELARKVLEMTAGVSALARDTMGKK